MGNQGEDERMVLKKEWLQKKGMNMQHGNLNLEQSRSHGPIKENFPGFVGLSL